MKFLPSIDNEALKSLPRIHFSGQIVVVESETELNNWLPILVKETVVGFDTESRPSFKKGITNGISLLQLANSKLALLIQIKKTGIPNVLKGLLENPNIVKVGVAIRDDLKGLQALRKFNSKGFIDLQQMVPNYGITEMSVKKLSAIVLGSTVSKSQQLSNWEAERLTEAQLIYASTDAWVCREIYIKLLSSQPNPEN